MTPENVLSAVQILVSVAGLIWFFYGPWQRLMIDAVRQKLFETRDSVFLLAADGKLDFESEEYHQIRMHYNLLIRYSHEFRWTHILAVALSGFKPPKKELPISNAVDRIKDEKLRQSLAYKWDSTLEHLGILFWLRSPVLMIITMLVLPLIILLIVLHSSFLPAFRKSVRVAVEREYRLDTKIQNRELVAA